MQTIFDYVRSQWVKLVAEEQDKYEGEDEIDRMTDFANQLLARNGVTGMSFSEGVQCLLLQDQTLVAVTKPVDTGMQNSPAFAVTKHMAGPSESRLPQEPSFGI
jgi:hypothetical protein